MPTGQPCPLSCPALKGCEWDLEGCIPVTTEGSVRYASGLFWAWGLGGTVRSGGGRPNTNQSYRGFWFSSHSRKKGQLFQKQSDFGRFRVLEPTVGANDGRAFGPEWEWKWECENSTPLDTTVRRLMGCVLKIRNRVQLVYHNCVPHRLPAVWGVVLHRLGAKWSVGGDDRLVTDAAASQPDLPTPGGGGGGGVIA